uniref:Uncharacterized protein n=1 Tax=Oryza punctata TaxID=4537 RepID=A0A0E0K2M8_ORYPU
MARSTRSAATEQAYSRFAPPASRGRGVGGGGGSFDEFDESDIWGSFEPAADVAESLQPARHQVPTARPPGRKAAASKPAAHGSLPVNIPDWSKILGDEYRGHYAGDWEADDVDDEDIDATTATSAVVVPPHELAWRRRAASLSVHDDGMGIGRTLKVRDAVWKKTGFQA